MANMAQQSLSIQLNPLLRVSGRAAPLADIVHQARAAGTDHFDVDDSPDAADATLVDLALHVDNATGPYPQPRLGVGYAGLSPRQRYEFLIWASDTPTQPAPAAFQQIYCAHLEARLIEGGDRAAEAHAELPRLWQAHAWQRSVHLARVKLLALWLVQDGAGLAAWIGLDHVPPDLVGIAVGCQALLGQPLDAREASVLSARWRVAGIRDSARATAEPSHATRSSDEPPHPARNNEEWPHATLDNEVLRLRLSSLETSLGQRLLDYALGQLPDSARAFQPWRANHRGLRIRFPQPDLRSALTPLLKDLHSLPAPVADRPLSAPLTPEADEALPDRGWQLILEFGNSRSEYFDVVMRTVQRLPGYAQLMDENRQMVHRVTFKRSELRRFWRIWDYVQSWSSTRVYLNGEELEKWKVWPYSQYMQ